MTRKITYHSVVSVQVLFILVVRVNITTSSPVPRCLCLFGRIKLYAKESVITITVGVTV